MPGSRGGNKPVRGARNRALGVYLSEHLVSVVQKTLLILPIRRDLHGGRDHLECEDARTGSEGVENGGDVLEAAK